jgi:hypothetical protein
LTVLGIKKVKEKSKQPSNNKEILCRKWAERFLDVDVKVYERDIFQDFEYEESCSIITIRRDIRELQKENPSHNVLLNGIIKILYNSFRLKEVIDDLNAGNITESNW